LVDLFEMYDDAQTCKCKIFKAVLQGRTWQKFVADIFMQQAQFDIRVVNIKKACVMVIYCVLELSYYDVILCAINVRAMTHFLAGNCGTNFGASAENALQIAAKMAATKMSSVTELFIGGGCGGGRCVYDGVLREGRP